jgi:predicted enzyme related to lactoylglutathione lyase
MPRVVHFEIQASRPQELIEFYSSLFGWTFHPWGENEYWLVETGPEDSPGINGGLLPRRGATPEEGQPANSFVCTVEIESVDDTLERAVGLGGKLAVPKMPIPGVGWLAYLKDPDGNILGLMQPDEQVES